MGFKDLSFEYEILSYKSEIFTDYIIYENIFKIKNNDIEFQEMVSTFSVTDNIVSVERNDIPI